MLTSPSTDTESPIACNLSAIATAERDAHLVTADQIFGATEAVRELSNGYALRLPATTEMLLKTAQFIDQERLCCSFFAFALEVEADGGPLWLRLTGREGVKEFIKSELGNHLGETVAAVLTD